MMMSSSLNLAVLPFSRARVTSLVHQRRSARQFLAMAYNAAETLSKEDEKAKLFGRIHEHQKRAAKLPHIEEARTILSCRTLGTLSTISKKYEGFPVGSMVVFASDDEGRPILVISTLSPHTRDLELIPKCSLLVPKDPQDRSDTVITIIGDAFLLSDQERVSAREIYLKKHPEAFWVDFGDFRILKIEPKTVCYVSGLVTGLAAVAEFDGDTFKSAKADAIAQFSSPIASHMNKDHSEDTKAIVEHIVGVQVDYATILDVDHLGFNVEAAVTKTRVKLRIPFPRAAVDRKDVKTLIVEMLQAAKAHN